jgi:hypothetical protein
MAVLMVRRFLMVLCAIGTGASAVMHWWLAAVMFCVAFVLVGLTGDRRV